jgi:geranylgeranyldiphosphate transferase
MDPGCDLESFANGLLYEQMVYAAPERLQERLLVRIRKGKGLAEDLRNREFSYPIVLALEAPGGEWVVRALECGSPRNIRKALEVIQSESVRNTCFAELKSSSVPVKDWLDIWGRDEKMNLKSQKK